MSPPFETILPGRIGGSPRSRKSSPESAEFLREGARQRHGSLAQRYGQVPDSVRGMQTAEQHMRPSQQSLLAQLSPDSPQGAGVVEQTASTQ